MTPLHWAAFGGHKASIVKLLSLGFEVNTLDAFGQTPAHTASRDGHLQAIRTLVSHGCDLEKAGNRRPCRLVGDATALRWSSSRKALLTRSSEMLIP